MMRTEGLSSDKPRVRHDIRMSLLFRLLAAHNFRVTERERGCE